MENVGGTREVIYSCAHPGDCQAVEENLRSFRVTRQPANLSEARRPSAAAGGERLVLRAEGSTAPFEEFDEVITVVEANPRRSHVAYKLNTPIFDAFGAVTNSVALVYDDAGTTLISLDGSRPPLVLDREFLFEFLVLEPSYLYNPLDQKFYRLASPLQRTALPAKLADLPDESPLIGDYHVIRVP